MRSLFFAVFGIALLAGVASQGGPGGAPARATETAQDEWQGLPPGTGREETFYLCGACHSLKIVTQQGLSRDTWDEAMDWMVEEQEMEPLEPAERKLIVDYLAKFYGPDRRAAKRK